MLYSSVLLAALAATAQATTYQGFNYASTNTDTSARTAADFEDQFSTAQKLVGASGFTSARLYTMIQADTTNDPILAIEAAITTQTTLLLGLWASAGDASFANEVAALTNAISKYGSKFTDLVVGLSVGSEDLYRNSPMGIAAKSDVGAEPSTIVNYISEVRKALANTDLDTVPIGHVDTWTAYVNGSNDAVIAACDWIGVDAYPYFQSTVPNDVSLGADLFFEALGNTTNAAGGKPVWITETGWPVSGPVSGAATASVNNAKSYWDQVACKVLGKYNTWWYTLSDAPASPSFGLVGATLTTQPLYDLTCPVVSSSSVVAHSSTTASGGSASASAHVVTSSGSLASVATGKASLATSSPTATGTVTGAPVAAGSSSAKPSGTSSGVAGAATGSSASSFQPRILAAIAAGLIAGAIAW